MGLDISIELLTLIMFGSLLALLMAGLPLAFVTGGLACVFLFVLGDERALNIVPSRIFPLMTNYQLSAIPLFIFMAAMLERAGLINEMFDVIYKVLGGVRGGLAAATVLASTVLAAMVGVIGAAVVTMGIIALPAMLTRGYDPKIAMGSIMAGGTLGILIPPSVILVIYAILTEQNIAKLFLAAFIPGILAAIGYIITISIYVRLNPGSAGTREPIPYAERFAALVKVWPVMTVFLLVVGGIYLGWFTPTEGAAVGAAGTGLAALLSGNLTWKIFMESIIATATATAMIFFIVFGAGFYNSFLALSQVPQELSSWVGGLGYSPWTILTIILIFYLVFGCLMDSLSMILLTIPIFFPVISALDFGMSTEHMAIWFGILVLIVVEVGLITPPVGMNLFIINSMDRETPMMETYKAVMYFVTSDIVRVIILVLFPSITLFLIP